MVEKVCFILDGGTECLSSYLLELIKKNAKGWSGVGDYKEFFCLLTTIFNILSVMFSLKKKIKPLTQNLIKSCSPGVKMQDLLSL